MKLVKNTKLFVDLTSIMVIHIMNNEIGCFDQFVLRETLFKINTYEIAARGWQFGTACHGMMYMICLSNYMPDKKDNSHWTCPISNTM